MCWVQYISNQKYIFDWYKLSWVLQPFTRPHLLHQPSTWPHLLHQPSTRPLLLHQPSTRPHLVHLLQQVSTRLHLLYQPSTCCSTTPLGGTEKLLYRCKKLLYFLLYPKKWLKLSQKITIFFLQYADWELSPICPWRETRFKRGEVWGSVRLRARIFTDRQQNKKKGLTYGNLP